MPPLRIIYAGSGEFGLPSLRAMLETGHEIIQVFTQPDRPTGRGRSVKPTAIAQFALDRALPLVRTMNINAEQPAPADVLVVIAFGQKISQQVARHARLGSINLHASLLPKFRGAAPINAAILAGESVTGNSVIRLAEKMDAGAILGQSRLEIGEWETAGELHDRLATDGAPLILSALDQLAAGTAREIEQNHSSATLAPKLSRDCSKIDWTRSADHIARQIRALFPWPGCHVRLLDERGAQVDRMTLVRARSNAGTGPPGTILQNSSLIGCGSGAVELIELQPAGKRPMSLSSYRNGHPWQAGMRLESVVHG
jgi:methionyl-tRNA formyltransferase